MCSFPEEQFVTIPQKWFVDYNNLGIDISSVYCESKLWWDNQILEFFDHYGVEFFKREAIWDVDWDEKGRMFGFSTNNNYNDPRNKLYKKIQKYLFKTQPIRKKYWVRKMDKLIRILLKY
jgi:hypothetical protein